MPGKYDIEGYGTYEIDSDDDAEIQSTISEIIAHEKAARASRPRLGGPTGLASKRLAALGGKPESEKGDFAPQPPIAGNAIPAIQPVISHAIESAGRNPISSAPAENDLAGGGVRRYVPEEWYQAPKKDIRPEARRRYAALTDQVAPREEGPETPKFIERHSRAMTAAIPETSAAPSAGGRFLRALDDAIGEMNPTNPVKPSDMLKAPGHLAEALNDYTDNAALLPISKLAGYLPDDPTWIPGAPAIQALANTRFGRGAVRGSGVDVGEGPISYKQGIEAALKVPEGFSRAGDVATLGAMSLPVVGPAILAGMIPEQIGQAGADLGDIAGGLIGGDPEGAGMRLPGAAVNAGMLGLMGSHGLKGLEAGRRAEAAAKEQAVRAAADRAVASTPPREFSPDYVQMAREAGERTNGPMFERLQEAGFAGPYRPGLPVVPGIEPRVGRGPAPVKPPEPPPTEPTPQPSVDPIAADTLATILTGEEAPKLPVRPPQPTVGDVPSWQDRQRAERAAPAVPPAEENIQVEPKATTDAQLKMVEEGQGQPGKKPGVLYTAQGGAKPPDVVPEGLARVDGPGGTLIFDPSKVTAQEATEALTSGQGLDKALGFSGPRPEPHPDNAVVSVLGKDGVEKSSQVAGPGDVEGAVKAAQGMAGEGDQVAVRTPGEVIADRQAGIEAEKKPSVDRRIEDKGPEGRLPFLDERAASIEERRELQRKIREDSLSPKKLARAKEELRETELHLKALDKKLGYEAGGPTAAQVEADLKERFGDRYEPDAPEPVEAPAAEMPKGKPARVWVSPTEPLDVEYKIVEADTVRTSHDKRTGEPTPGFPQRKQPRDRSRESYLRQQAEIGQRPNPDLLLEGPEASVGAPITSEPGPEGIRDAEHGNGRTNGIRIAYEDGNAGEYRQRLIDDAARYGTTPEAVAGMREPILIRERKTDLSAKEQVSIAKESNKGTAERMGTAEQAAVDAGAMTPELLSQFAPSESGDIMAASNRPFLRGFFSEIADSGDMVDRAGNVSAAGVARVKAAILAKAYGETSVLERALEAADDNTRNVSAGLLSAAPRVAKVRAMAEGGELHPVDFTTPIKEAVDHLAHARDQGVSVADYLDQQDLFGDQISPEGRDVLSFLDKNKRSPKKIAGFIDSLARAVEAAGHPDQTDLFGGAPDAPSRAETFASAKRIYESRFESEGAQGGLFDQTGSGGPDRGEGPGATPGGGGGAPGGGRPGGGEPGVYGSPSRSRRALARSRAGGAEATPEPEPVRPGGPAPEATVRADVERGDGVYEAPTSAPRAATMTGSGKKAETNPRQIIKELERITGTPIRYNFGHFAQRGAEGWFNRETNAIRMKQAEDLVTGAHEAGHSLHTFALKDQQHFPAAVSIELTRLGRDLYGPKPPNSGYIREGMAEYVAKYLIGDDMTKDAPAVHSWVRSNMPAEKLKALDAARELYEKWDVAGSVGRVKGKMVDADTSFVSRMKDGLDKLVRMASPKMWTNKFSGLDEAMREVTDQLGLTEVHPMQDVARLGAALEKNATGSAYAAVTEGVPDLAGKKAGGGLKDALEKIPFKQLEDFAAYAYARRAVDLWERRAYDPDTKKRTGDPTPINPGISLKDAKQAAQQLESPEFRDALDKVTAWSNHLIDYVVKSGGLTPEEAVIIREANPVYVPLKRFFEESVQRGESGGGGGGLKRIKGSGRSVLNPVYSLVEHAATMIRLGDRLRVARAVADLVDPVNVGQSGTKGYGGLAWFAEKIQAPKDSTSFGVADIKKQLEAAGADLTGADLGRVLTVFQNAKEYHGKQNIISIVRNGTREFYEVDPRVYDVLMRTEPHAVNPVMQALQAAKRGVQLGATGLNAGFSLVSNVLRDMPTSSIYSKSPGLVTPIDTFKAVWKEIQKSPEAQRWERGGGSMSTLIGQDRLASRRIIEEMLAKTPTEKGWVTFKHPVDALRKGLGIFESGPRIAEYERMLKTYEQKYGVDSEAAHLMAMLASKDVTVNFTRAGIVSEAINRIVPFFNARIQGASKFYRTFGGDYLESRGTARQPDAGKAALAATAKAMAWITVPTFALWVANKDEEWYQELPAWQKGAFWVWSPDHGKTKYRIPKPMELGWVFGSLPEAAWDYAYRQNGRGVMDALAGTVNSLMPIDVTRGASSLADLIPAGAKPLLEFGINYDAFRNRPIVDPFLERRKLPKDQYQRQTSETAKKLGEWLKISPSKIDHVAGGLTGGLALEVVKSMEIAVGARKAGSIEGLYDVPVLNRLALRPSPGVSVDHMHEQDALLRQKVGSKVATEEEKATLKRIAAAKTAIDHARLAAEGAKGDDLHTLNTWSTHMAQWALGKRAEMPEEELESLEEKFPSEEWGKAFKAMRRKIPTYEAEAPPE